MSEPETITFREVGSNPLEDQANASVRVDMSKNRLLPRLGKIFWPGREGDKPVASPPAPPIDPVVELEQKRELLAHLQSQFAIVRARTADNPATSTTPIQAVASVKQRYVKRLTDLENIASEEWADCMLLGDLLNRCGEGLIPSTQARVAQLESQTKPPAARSEEYRRLTAAEDKAFLAWGRARKARRAYEAAHPVGQARHEYKLPRAAFGVNFGRVDSNTIQRVAEMASNMSDSK